MDWKQFIVEIISNLAWPSVAIVFLFQFRHELAKVAQRIARVKYKDLELDFEKLKNQAEEVHKEIEHDIPELDSPILISLEDQILDAVERAPSAAILLAWSGLETAIASAVARLAISADSPSYRSPMHNIEMLSKYSRLSKKHESLLNEMRILRNKVAHHRDELLAVSQEQARDYSNTAIELMKHIEKYQRAG